MAESARVQDSQVAVCRALQMPPINELAAMLQSHAEQPAWPGLNDPAVRRRAVRYARRYGLWERLGKTLDAKAPLAATRRSTYREWSRSGGAARESSDPLFQEMRLVEDAALALWLGHPAADLDYLQDLLWAWCEKSTWSPSCHEGYTIDLISSAMASFFSEILWMFAGRIESEVRDRVRAEVQRRVLDPGYDYRRVDWWRTCDMNWNAVCNGNIIGAALYHFQDDAQLLATYLHPIIPRLQYAVDGFLDDGSCREGTGYWVYGFGHIVDAAIVLHHRTGGKIDLFADPKIERICRFPLATQIAGPVRASFGDSGQGWISGDIAVRINRFCDIPQLYAIAERHPDGAIAVNGWRGLCLFRGEKAGEFDGRDYVLPDLGFAKLCAGAGPKAVVLTALAGRNDFPHNHNDIGNFILYKQGHSLLTDPGGPIYTAKTFGPRRYEIIHCRSRGHSVPLINGREQPPGGEYFGTLEVSGVNARGEKRVTIDMARAYDDRTLKSLRRELVLAEGGALEITDRYEFSRAPGAVEEAFVTYEPVTVAGDRRSVRIGKGKATLRLSAPGTAGRFSAEDLGEESRSWHTPGQITRIAFRPARLTKAMTLAFRAE